MNPTPYTVKAAFGTFIVVNYRSGNIISVWATRPEANAALRETVRLWKRDCQIA